MSANLSLTKIKLGNSATPANNFLISVPDTADGTLTIERENGTDVMTIDAAGKVVFPGNAQTWQDVKASRALGILYTNSTGLTIVITVSGTSSVLNGCCVATVDGANLSYTSGASGVSGVITGTWSIPAGSTYSINNAVGVATLSSWMELR